MYDIDLETSGYDGSEAAPSYEVTEDLNESGMVKGALIGGALGLFAAEVVTLMDRYEHDTSYPSGDGPLPTFLRTLPAFQDQYQADAWDASVLTPYLLGISGGVFAGSLAGGLLTREDGPGDEPEEGY